MVEHAMLCKGPNEVPKNLYADNLLWKQIVGFAISYFHEF